MRKMDWVATAVIGLVALMSTVTICYLAASEKPVEALVASLATGSMALLVPSPLQGARQRVVVDNPPEDPVPVEAH